MKFHITHLYPEEMSLYGDMGNIHAMRWTLNSMGIDVEYQAVRPGQSLPTTTHFYFIGGGQDKQQMEIADDLIAKGGTIIHDINNGVPLLAICGGYQLLGKEFVTGDSVSIPGVGLFPVVTKALNASIQSRSIGDVVVKGTVPGLEGVDIVGFENHSGQTYITDSSAQPLGKVVVGKGNNYEEGLEGCVFKNAIGTYLHGSCLPKNPAITELLINAGLQYMNLSSEGSVDQSIALKAQKERLRILL
jgi:hypothetical protein